MTNFFEKRVQWGQPMALWVLVVMVFVAPIAVWSLKQIHLENDIHNWLPDDDPQKQILTWYDDHFHPEDRMFLSTAKMSYLTKLSGPALKLTILPMATM